MTEPAGDTHRTGLTPAMRITLWAAAGLAVAGLVLAFWLTTAGGGGGAPGAEPGSTTSTPTPGGDGQDEGTSPADPAPTRGPVPGATPTTGSEVLPPTSPAASGGLAPLPSPTPLVAAPLPKSASETGSLVEGFPTHVMAPAPDSDVVSSSIATEDELMQVTLVARTDASAESVTTHYREAWAQLGLSDSSPGDEVVYADSLTSLTLAFTPSGTGTVYTVYGILRTH